MCGIAGFVQPDGFDQSNAQALLSRMTDQLEHRGPDGEGRWVDANAGVALGHRRLAIVDLSAEGRQPMISSSSRYIISFNGEVYNFLDLRRRLAKLGHEFRGQSDTEVALAAIEQWGVGQAVAEFIGMFAFALWDTESRTITLCRDRLGKKPLYFSLSNNCLLFGSELKAIRVHPKFYSEVDRDALALFLRHNYVPSPWSIYKGTQKLRPGHLATFRVDGGQLRQLDNSPYWSITGVYERATPYRDSFSAASRELESLLRDAVRLRMISDVPLGAFLSGGIDSSLIVALMQAESSTPIKTFTIGFHEQGYNEAVFAKEVAKHLRTDHTEVYLDPKEALRVVPRLPVLYDEPFADASQIPTHLVSLIARRKVTVALSGDGGDELFCGYNRYLWWRQIWRLVGGLPAPARALIGRAIKTVPIELWNGTLRASKAIIPSQLADGVPGEKMHKLAEVMIAHSPDELYRRLVSHWTDPGSVVLGATEPNTVLGNRSGVTSLDGFTEHMMRMDLLTYLPDDILVKVDRASMGVSLEARAPLLDHRVVEFSARLPLHFKLKHSSGKLILKDILSRHVPSELYERPKAGFGVPIDTWLKGPLREWTEDLLSPDRLTRQGFFDVQTVRNVWQSYLQRGTRSHYLLWDILMFQAWLEHTEGSSTA